MTTASIPSPDTPQALLDSLRTLTRKVRTAQRGAWFPLLLLGVLFAVEIVAGRLTFRVQTVPCPEGAGPGPCTGVKDGAPFSWTLGLVLVYAATTVFYIRRSRSRGVGSPIRAYLIAGLVILTLVAPTRFWSAGPTTPPGAAVDFWGLHFHATSGVVSFLTRLTGRAMSVGLPLLVLSWIERNRALLLFTLAYAIIELVPVTLGDSQAAPGSPWSALPRLVVPTLFLLLGALGFALAERPKPGSEAGPEAGSGPGPAPMLADDPQRNDA